LPNHLNILDTPIEYVKGIGPSRGETFRKELNIHTVRNLLYTFPFRYIDRTKFHLIKDVKAEGDNIQLKGTLVSVEKIKGKTNRSRITGTFKDSSGFLELVWFQGVTWLEKSLKEGEEYIIYGKVNVFNGNKSMVHPEMELVSESAIHLTSTFDPVYPSTEKMDAKGLDSKTRRKIINSLLVTIEEKDVSETLPPYILEKLKISSAYNTLKWIHFPSNEREKELAVNRIKFEEFFFVQVRLLLSKIYRKYKYRSAPFATIGHYFNTFYNDKLPYELTNAQKKVIKEIRADMGKPVQMNRLLQGDVGSGKTIVALLSMLIALGQWISVLPHGSD
jgi:ATP-dependent DNA helicase RecG